MGRSILKGFILILTGKVSSLLLGILITPILVRLLGSEQYGVYAYLTSILAVTLIFVDAGTFDGVRKFVAESRDEFRYWTEYVFGYYLRIGIVFALGAATLYLLIAIFGYSSIFGDGVHFEVLMAFALLIILRQAYSLVRSGLMGLGLESYSEPIVVLRKVLFGACSVYLVIQGYGVLGVLIGHIIANFISSCLSLVIISRKLRLVKVVSSVPPKFPKSELVSFNGMSVLLILLMSSLYHVDVLLLKPLSGNTQIGYYKAALVIAEFLWFVPTALQNILLQSASEIWSEGHSERISGVTSAMTRFNIYITSLMAIGILVLAPDFVPLYYGSGFKKSITPLILLVPGALGFAIARPIFAVGQGKGDLRPLIMATGTAAFLNICLNLLLIPKYGMVGAAVATSISYASMLALHIFAAFKIGFNPIRDLQLFRIILMSLVTGPTLFGIASYVQSPVVSILIVPPTGFILYSILAIKFQVITTDEIISKLAHLPTHIRDPITQLIKAIDGK